MTLRRMLIVGSIATACGSRLDVGLGIAESGSSTTGADGTSSSGSSAGDTTAATNDAGSDSGTTSSSAGSSAAGDASSGDSGTDTDGLEETPCASEQKVCAQVELDGAPAGFCGETLELKGITQALGPGLWSIEDCGSCGLCGGDAYEIQFFGPAGWVPTELPLCSRITIDFAPLDASPFACAFTGVAVWSDRGSSEDPAPVYVAASITTDPPAGVGGLQVTRETVEPKACDRMYCCYEPPGKYELTFAGAGIGTPVVLAEHEEAIGVGAFGLTYDLRDERSHAHEQCDRIPHFDWILRR